MSWEFFFLLAVSCCFNLWWCWNAGGNQRDDGSSNLGDTQNSASQGPGQRDLIAPAAEQRTDHLKGSLPTSIAMILRLWSYRIARACFLLPFSQDRNSHWLGPPANKIIRYRQMAALTSIPKATKTTKSHQSPFVSCSTLISKKLKSPTLLQQSASADSDSLKTLLNSCSHHHEQLKEELSSDSLQTSHCLFFTCKCRQRNCTSSFASSISCGGRKD